MFRIEHGQKTDMSPIVDALTCKLQLVVGCNGRRGRCHLLRARDCGDERRKRGQQRRPGDE